MIFVRKKKKTEISEYFAFQAVLNYFSYTHDNIFTIKENDSEGALLLNVSLCFERKNEK